MIADRGPSLCWHQHIFIVVPPEGLSGTHVGLSDNEWIICWWSLMTGLNRLYWENIEPCVHHLSALTTMTQDFLKNWILHLQGEYKLCKNIILIPVDIIFSPRKSWVAFLQLMINVKLRIIWKWSTNLIYFIDNGRYIILCLMKSNVEFVAICKKTINS